MPQKLTPYLTPEGMIMLPRQLWRFASFCLSFVVLLFGLLPDLRDMDASRTQALGALANDSATGNAFSGRGTRGSLVHRPKIISVGRPPDGFSPDDSRFVLAGRGAAPDIQIWPGLHIRRQWRLADPEHREIDIDCRVGLAHSEPGVGQVVFLCEAFVEENVSIAVKSSSMTGAVRELMKHLPGGDDGNKENSSHSGVHFNGPQFFGLRSVALSKMLDPRILKGSNSPADNSQHLIFESTTVKSGPPNQLVQWQGVVSAGVPRDSPTWKPTYNSHPVQLREGYQSHLRIMTNDNDEYVDVICSVEAFPENPAVPLFKVSGGGVSADGLNPTAPTREFLKKINATTAHNYNGAEFFGFLRTSTIATTSSEPPAKQARQSDTASINLTYPLLVQLEKLHRRGGVPTSSLRRRRSVEHRNELVHEAATFASFGDVQSYIKWILQHHPELIQDALEDATEGCMEKFFEQVPLTAMRQITVSDKDSAELLIGPVGLTQRAYKAMRRCLQEKGVYLSRLSGVCKRWRNMSETASLWNDVRLPECTTTATLCRLAVTSLRQTQVLNLMDVNASDTGVEALAAYCHNLREVSLKCTHLHPAALNSMLSANENLAALGLDGVRAGPFLKTSQCTINGSRLQALVVTFDRTYIVSPKLTSLIPWFMESCPNLKELDLRNNSKTHWGVSHWHHFPQHLQELRLLNIIPQMLRTEIKLPQTLELFIMEILCSTGAAILSYLEDVVSSLQAAKHLKHLSLPFTCSCGHCQAYGNNSAILDVVMDLDCVENLQVLCLHGHKWLKDNVLQCFVQMWQHSLVEVDVSSTAVSDACIGSLITCSRLRHLNLSGCNVSPTGVGLLISPHSSLKRLNLQKCRSLPRGTRRVYGEKEFDQLRSCLSQAH